MTRLQYFRPFLATLLLSTFLACGGGGSSLLVSNEPTNGDLDTSFGSSGRVTTSINGTNDAIQAIAVQSDGKIVVAGYSTSGTYRNFAVARYTTAGVLDTAFSSDGIATTPVGSGNAEAFALGIQSDGKIVVAGYYTVSGNRQIALARYTSTGTLDSSFGSAGVATQSIGTASMARALVIESSGSIIVGGYAQPSSSVPGFALARFTSAGVLDTSFGTSGIVKTAIGSTDDEIYAIALSGTKIVAAGYTDNGTHKNFALARYNSDGSLDTGFSGDGLATADSIYDNRATSLVIQSDGGIVAAGGVSDGTSYRFALAHYTSAGVSNWAFTTDFSTITDDAANALVAQSDGKLLAGGVSGPSFGFARYSSSGTLDTSFGTSGLLTGTMESGTSANVINAMAVQSDGKILAAGYDTSSSTTKFALLRFYP